MQKQGEGLGQFICFYFHESCCLKDFSAFSVCERVDIYLCVRVYTHTYGDTCTEYTELIIVILVIVIINIQNKSIYPLEGYLC